MGAGTFNIDSFSKLAEGLGELEVTVGPGARPIIAEVRQRLIEATAQHGNGDASGAIDTIRRAMMRLASLAGELDPAEGALMTMIANRFAGALSFGDKDLAKETVNFIRHRAGDPKDDPNTDW